MHLLVSWVAFQCWEISHCSVEMNKNCWNSLICFHLIHCDLSCTGSKSRMSNKMEDECFKVCLFLNLLASFTENLVLYTHKYEVSHICSKHSLFGHLVTIHSPHGNKHLETIYDIQSHLDLTGSWNLNALLRKTRCFCIILWHFVFDWTFHILSSALKNNPIALSFFDFLSQDHLDLCTNEIYWCQNDMMISYSMG